jgi:hypothetical protein
VRNDFEEKVREVKLGYVNVLSSFVCGKVHSFEMFLRKNVVGMKSCCLSLADFYDDSRGLYNDLFGAKVENSSWVRFVVSYGAVEFVVIFLIVWDGNNVVGVSSVCGEVSKEGWSVSPLVGMSKISVGLDMVINHSFDLIDGFVEKVLKKVLIKLSAC